MAIFIKGSAIENATSYGLYKKVEENYEMLAEQAVGQRQIEAFPHNGCIDSNGCLSTELSYASSFYTTDFIHVDKLVNYPTNFEPERGECASVMYHEDVDYNLLALYSEADETTFIEGEGYTYDRFLSFFDRDAEAVKERAHNIGAKYVRFSSYIIPSMQEENPTFVGLTRDIFFCLDELKGQLTAGTHQLVVKAIGEGGVDADGDGIIYTDSEYSNEVVYTVGDDSEGETVTLTVVLNDKATYDAATNVIGGTSTNTASLISANIQATAIVNEPITAGMEIEVEAICKDGLAHAEANKAKWSIAVLGLSKTNVLADMTMNPYTTNFPVGEANIYLDQPGSSQAYKVQYMKSDTALGKVELKSGYLYPNGDTVMAVKIIFRKNTDGNIAVKVGDNDWFDYSTNSKINALQQYKDGVSADTLYFFTSGVGATQVKVNYIGEIR